MFISTIKVETCVISFMIKIWENILRQKPKQFITTRACHFPYLKGSKIKYQILYFCWYKIKFKINKTVVLVKFEVQITKRVEVLILSNIASIASKRVLEHFK